MKANRRKLDFTASVNEKTDRQTDRHVKQPEMFDCCETARDRIGTEQNKTEHRRTEQNTNEQNRTEHRRTEQNRTQANRTEHRRTEQNRTQTNRTEQNTGELGLEV